MKKLKKDNFNNFKNFYFKILKHKYFYCSRFIKSNSFDVKNKVKDPIELSCDDSICREHLSERDVIKQNRIKCKKCKQEFEVKENEFRSNKTYAKLIERE